MLHDNAFKPITRLSSWESRAEAVKRARLVLITHLAHDLYMLTPFSMLLCLQELLKEFYRG